MPERPTPSPGARLDAARAQDQAAREARRLRCRRRARTAWALYFCSFAGPLPLLLFSPPLPIQGLVIGAVVFVMWQIMVTPTLVNDWLKSRARAEGMDDAEFQSPWDENWG